MAADPGEARRSVHRPDTINMTVYAIRQNTPSGSL